MTKEALTLALDYIVATNKNSEFWLIPASNLNKTVNAIKEALAKQCVCGEPNSAGTHRTDGPCLALQPEQEPTPTPNEGFEGSIRIFLKKSDGQWERLEKLEQVHEYNKQQWTQPEQEPVAWWNGNSKFATPKAKDWDKRTGGTTAFGCDIPLYTTPPQRKPLTWERVLVIVTECANDRSRLPYEVKIARAIEAAHGIKENT